MDQRTVPGFAWVNVLLLQWPRACSAEGGMHSATPTLRSSKRDVLDSEWKHQSSTVVSPPMGICGSYIVAHTSWLKHSGSSSIPETISKVCYDVELLDPTEEGFTSHTFLICLCILFVFVFYLYDEKKGKQHYK